MFWVLFCVVCCVLFVVFRAFCFVGCSFWYSRCWFLWLLCIYFVCAYVCGFSWLILFVRVVLVGSLEFSVSFSLWVFMETCLGEFVW